MKPLQLVRDFILSLSLAVSVAAQFNCQGGGLYIVAHADDDLLFASPTILNEIQSGACVTTVIVSAGDSGRGMDFVRVREQGSDAAYASMAGISTSFSDSYATFGGQSVLIRTSTAQPGLQRVILRLPDGNVDGSGFSANGQQSLQKLYQGSIPSVKSVDGRVTFTLATFKQAISQIISARRPSSIRTQDYESDYDTGDHSDHLTVARITAEGRSVTGFAGYGIANLPVNVPMSSNAFAGKSKAFYAYGNFDTTVCSSTPSCQGTNELNWMQREYTMSGPTSNSGGAANTTGSNNSGGITAPSNGNNIAGVATVTASSQYSTAQAASKAVDGQIGGYPGNPSQEWASNGQRTGAWLNLAWASSATISQVVIYDRPNNDDWLQSGTLTFDNNVVVEFSGVPNDGSAFSIPLPQTYTTRSLRLTVSSVSGSTSNVGLAEIQVYGSVSSSSGSPSTTASSVTTSTASSTTASSTSTTATGGSGSSSAGNNLARNAVARASSESTGQTADKAIDGIVSGYKPDGSGTYTSEWASDHQREGAWLSLTWSSPITLNRVVLYDRPNPYDWITAGTITFSDGSTVQFGALDNNGGATNVDFASKTISSLRVTVSSVGSQTSNIGLSEIQVYSSGSGSSTASTTSATTSTTSTTTSSTTTSSTRSTTSSRTAASSTATNLARQATASSSSFATGQGAAAAVDGVISGYPANPGSEWASRGEKAGAWLNLSWSSAVTASRIVLYDRPNGSDQVTAGRITFSDGSTVTVPSLDNGGQATTISFSPRRITSLRFTVTSVSQSTQNIGLSEIQVF